MGKFAYPTEISPEDAVHVGKKAVQLSQLQGLSVPEFFVLTAEFFMAVIDGQGKGPEFRELSLRLPDPEAGQKLSTLIAAAAIPEALQDALYKRYLKLSYNPSEVRSAFDLIKKQKEGLVAVRASEPYPHLATYTNIRGKEELVKAVKLCWKSYYSVQDPNSIPPSLIVQRMIVTEKACEVRFDEGRVHIKAYWGQTGFLSQLTPDVYELDEASYEVADMQTGLQQSMFIFEAQKGGFSKKEVPEEARDSRVLEDDELQLVASFARRVYERLGDVRVEIGISQDKPYLINIKDHNKQEEVKVKVEEEDFISEDGIINHEGYDEATDEASEEDSLWEKENPPAAAAEAEAPWEAPRVDTTAQLEAIFRKYTTINPQLKDVLDLLKQDVLQLLR
jgi:pyruvate, water dikinase